MNQMQIVIYYMVYAYTIEIDREREREREIIDKPTSLLPLPKPLITDPDNLMGNGDSGPPSGPATGSRVPSGRILFAFRFAFPRRM